MSPLQCKENRLNPLAKMSNASIAISSYTVMYKALARQRCLHTSRTIVIRRRRARTYVLSGVRRLGAESVNCATVVLLGIQRAIWRGVHCADGNDRRSSEDGSMSVKCRTVSSRRVEDLQPCLPSCGGSICRTDRVEGVATTWYPRPIQEGVCAPSSSACAYDRSVGSGAVRIDVDLNVRYVPEWPSSGGSPIVAFVVHIATEPEVIARCVASYKHDVRPIAGDSNNLWVPSRYPGQTAVHVSVDGIVADCVDKERSVSNLHGRAKGTCA